MTRKEVIYVSGILTVGALLLANLLRPGVPYAFDAPSAPAVPVAISAAGDSAWAVVGNKAYFLSLRNRSDIPNRIITVIDDEELK